MKMNPNSLFAILLRSPWWLSFAIAIGLAALSRAILRDVPMLFASLVGLPFIVIGCIAAWKQLRTPGSEGIAKALDGLRTLSGEEFAGKLASAYQRDGFAAKRITGAADLELEKSGRLTLVACKRWKATRTGVEPLRELETLRRKREAPEAVYIAAGEITDTARSFAAQSGIRLLEGPELAALV
jgi:restriction system protein